MQTIQFLIVLRCQVWRLRNVESSIEQWNHRAVVKAVVEGYNGTGIPFLMDSDGHCQAIVWPEAGLQMATMFCIALVSTAEMAKDL